MQKDRKNKGIIILGHPRSGTTLLRRLLNGHSQIACPPETHLLSACARFLESERTAHGVDIGVLAGLNFAGIEDNIVIERLRDFAFSFLSQCAEKQGKSRWAEKTAFDAFHTEKIEQICRDQALYMGIVRHGLDVAISSKEFCDAAGLYPEVMHKYICRYPKPIEAFSHSWLDVNQSLLDLKDRNPNNCIICRYEDLVEDPQNCLGKLLDFVGEEFEPALLEKSLDEKSQLGFSDHKSYQTRKIHDTSVARWHSLPEMQINELAPLLNPLLDKLGYDSLKAGTEVTTTEARRRYTSSLKLITNRRTASKLISEESPSWEGHINFYGTDRIILGDSARRIRRTLDEETSKKILDAAKTVPPAIVFSVILLAFLRRVTNNDDLCIGVSILSGSDRGDTPSLKKEKRFTIRLGIKCEETFNDVFHKAIRAYDDAQSSHKIADREDIGTIEALLNDYTSFHPLLIDDKNSESKEDWSVDCQNPLTVNLDFSENSSAFIVTMDFNKDVWPDSREQERAFEHYVSLVNSYANDPDQVIDKVLLLTPEERELILPMGDLISSPAKRLPRVIDSFAEQVSLRPDHPAVVFSGKQFTYAELGQRVWKLSAFLRAIGVGPGELVVVCMNRSLDMVTALLAVMHTGSAYVPVDPEHPESRINKILEDVNPVILLSDQAAMGKLGSVEQAKILCVDKGEWLASSVTSETESDIYGEFAYIIFTSGSTGRPKGVEVLHHGLSAFLSAMCERPGFSKSDRLLAVTTISFDIAGLELFLPLITGATVYIAAHSDAADGLALQKLLTTSDINVFQATPATYHILIASGWKGSPNLKLLCGGEALPASLAANLLERCGELWNMYGPTETTIWSTTQKVEFITSQIPIGRPILGTHIYILNESLVPVPLGVSGELYIGGEGLAQGYHNRPDLTAEKFIADPFSHTKGARMYRTGDFVRCPDGENIEYIERLDNQVKIRGYRIELGEIETEINVLESVRQNVVCTYESAAGMKALAVYIVQEQGAEKIDIDTIRMHLTPRLPNYMIPTVAIILEALPLTPNNKIDRKALPKPSESDFSTNQGKSTPTNSIERKIVESWKKLLGVSHISSEDSFLVLGGDSLSFVQATMELEDILGHIPDNWDTLSIHELSKIRKNHALLQNFDSVVLIRAIAITSVVLNHLGLGIVSGATNALFLASGYIFANFQLQTVCNRGNSFPILSSALWISIPTILYTAFIQVWDGEFHIENLLLVGNFMQPGFDAPDTYWWIYVLVQILLILAFIFNFRIFRHQAEIKPFSFAVTLLAISGVLYLFGSYFWDTSQLYNRVPHMKLWMFVIGWCIFLCDTNTKKIAIALALILLPHPWQDEDPSSLIYLISSGLILLAIPTMKLIFPINRMLQYIAAASLFIYLTHFQFSGLYYRLGFDNHRIFNVVIALVGGIIVWRLWVYFLSRLNALEWVRRILPQSQE